MYNPSTFFTSIIPPVYMSDDDNSQSYERSVVSNTETFDYKEENVSDDESIPVEFRSTPEYQELINLKRLRKEKLGYKAAPTEHVGFKCDRCDIEPIVDTRWHCTDCPPDIAVDFCEQLDMKQRHTTLVTD